jgi:hypothetical protein
MSEFRTMQGDRATVVITLLEIKLACDIEMVNMGDWSLEDYDKHCQPYNEAIKHIKSKNNIYGTDPKILQEVENTFALFIKTFKDHEV